MAPAPYRERLAARIDAVKSRVCVGLDPDPAKLPAGVGLAEFVLGIVDATIGRAACFKPNFAFYEALGREGRDALVALRKRIPADVPMILDAKVADIGNTSERYAVAAFDELGADALTVNPYLGSDSVEPFLKRADKGVYLLCLTSNAGSADFQKQPLWDGRPLYLHVAKHIKAWNDTYGTAGAVVGATHEPEMADLRTALGDAPLLVPGVGAQGGDAGAVCRHLVTKRRLPVVVNASRSILYASSGADWAAAAGAETARLADELAAVEAAQA